VYTTIEKQGFLSLRRILARYMAGQAGKLVMSPENPRDVARKRMDAGGDRTPPPADVDIQPTELAGRPALRFTPHAKRPGRLLFLHGGGYCLGSPQSHKVFTARLARVLKLEAVSVDYRMAPEHVFPAGVDDGAAALHAIQTESDGPVIISGDSAGGGLSLATLLRHRDQGRPMPDGAYLISPWTDLTASGESTKTRAAADPMLKPDWLSQGAALYLDGADPKQPEASPLFADLSGLPPMLIQVGDQEILRDDSIRFADRLSAAGVPVQCEVWQALWHDFQMFAPILPEADQALERVAAWAEPVLSASKA